jgi:hypothetical protein
MINPITATPHWLILVTVLALSGCASNTKIVRSYVDPSVAQRSLEGVLVVAVARKEDSRIDFEDAFARVLTRHGARSVASHTLGLKQDDKAATFLAAAEKAGLASILVTRYVGEKADEIYHPGTIYYDVMPAYTGYGGGFGGYYGHAYEVAYQQPVWSTNTTYTIITDLFTSSDKAHLYQAISDTIQAGGQKKLRDDIISGLVKDMKGQGLFD